MSWFVWIFDSNDKRRMRGGGTLNSQMTSKYIGLFKRIQIEFCQTEYLSSKLKQHGINRYQNGQREMSNEQFKKD